MRQSTVSYGSASSSNPWCLDSLKGRGHQHWYGAMDRRSRFSRLSRYAIAATLTCGAGFALSGSVQARGGHGGGAPHPATYASPTQSQSTTGPDRTVMHTVPREDPGAFHRPASGGPVPSAPGNRPMPSQSSSGAASTASTSTITTSAAPASLPDLTPPVESAPSPVNVPTVAPLAPPLDTTISGGGTATGQSRPGGGGKTLADCMAMWDAGTHMTKSVWRQACQRTLNGLELPDETTATEATPNTRFARGIASPARARVHVHRTELIEPMGR